MTTLNRDLRVGNDLKFESRCSCSFIVNLNPKKICVTKCPKSYCLGVNTSFESFRRSGFSRFILLRTEVFLLTSYIDFELKISGLDCVYQKENLRMSPRSMKYYTLPTHLVLSKS